MQKTSIYVQILEIYLKFRILPPISYFKDQFTFERDTRLSFYFQIKGNFNPKYIVQLYCPGQFYIILENRSPKCEGVSHTVLDLPTFHNGLSFTVQNVKGYLIPSMIISLSTFHNGLLFTVENTRCMTKFDVGLNPLR